ncbi:Sulfotransferase domain protein [Pseudoalteromonas sp. P1-9]|uniref:tetratricopeptide repeat-containing sulfotransferase family protein n=1 Tax=Pseudoalteromonas sp. P1-9 TaxID=1710354 RepID=UPI0006D61C1A|nr:tetratricopeptide repeat-containing sulfotransferase family protein [Pseudoalteromonas sp. P1-9]KPV95557.1 Sulfotransferase domain protein [Pseudoalteromonas sp. P1-9]
MKLDNHKLTPQQANLYEIATNARRNKNYSVALHRVNDILNNLSHFEPAVLEAALILFETSNFEAAENILLKLIDSPFEVYAKSHALAVINKSKRNFKNAIYYYQKACVHKPNSAVDLLGLSFCYSQVGDFESAIEVCKTRLDNSAENVLLDDYLATLYTQSNQYEKAETLLQKNIKANRDNSKALYSLANIKKAKGEIIKAKELYKRAIEITPNLVMAHYGLSVVTNYKKEGEGHLAQLNDLYSNAQLHAQDRILLAFSLAKAYEQNEKYKQSFSYLKQGNDLRFKMLNYDVRADLAFIDNIKSAFTRKDIEPLQIHGNKSQKPIFIVGMPRSGTSLIEKIIGSHTSVFNAGEIETFFSLSCTLLDSNTYLFENVANLHEKQIKALSDQYLAKINSLSSGSCFITDKLPLNFLMVGVIKILFPNAKIIHCKRDRNDTCLSIYKKNFSNDNYRFAYNLEALAKYYKSYEILMAHWHAEFPGEILDVHYEKLALNPTEEIQNLIAQCGLEWQESCLDFHKTPSIVKTASAVQVRQPMYTNSIGLWHQYEEELSELIKLLNSKADSYNL